MLLQRSVNGSGDDLGHLFAAADHRYAGIPDKGYDIAAVAASIKMLFHGYVPPVLVFLLGIILNNNIQTNPGAVKQNDRILGKNSG